MTNAEIWQMLHKYAAPDPLTGAEAIVINDIKTKMDITIASEGFPRSYASKWDLTISIQGS